MRSTCPVMYRDASDSRNTTTGAMSSALPVRRSGTTGWRRACTSGSVLLAEKFVPDTSPGAMPLTRTPDGPHSSAICSVSDDSAAFAALYAPAPGAAKYATSDDVFTMAPPWARSEARAAWLHHNAESRSTRNT